MIRDGGIKNGDGGITRGGYRAYGWRWLAIADAGFTSVCRVL